MKKIVIIILAVLPIFLLVVISFAGRFFSEVSHIAVEGVAFVDDLDNRKSVDDVIVLNKGETHNTKIKIYPELASNKKVIYTSNDHDVCTIDENGVITAIGNKLGVAATITVKTEENAKVAILLVKVEETNVSSVEIRDNIGSSLEELTLAVREVRTLNVSVGPYTAKDKRVVWTSSDPNVVTVDSTGKITALQTGTAVITVISVDGGLTDTCLVIVGEGKAKLSFNFDGCDFINLKNVEQHVYEISINTLKLDDYIEFDETTISREQIIFEVSIKNSLDQETNILTISEGQMITVKAYVSNNKDIYTEIRLVLVN